MEIQRMFDNLLASIDWDEAAEHSYSNFHVRGLSYLNLLRSDRLTVKLYTFYQVKHNSQGFLVYPHTHGYNFSHRTMAGKIMNHRFALTELAHPDEREAYWNLYTFQTPLNGGAGLTKVMPCGLTELEPRLLPPGGSYYLDHEEIHTLSVATDYAAALLIQYHDVSPGSPTVMFAPHDVIPDCSSGLYHRMNAHTGRMLVEHYQDHISEGDDGDDDYV